jgi:hypothetical protein
MGGPQAHVNSKPLNERNRLRTRVDFAGHNDSGDVMRTYDFVMLALLGIWWLFYRKK